MNPFNMFGPNGFIYNAMNQMAMQAMQPPVVPPYKGTYRVFPVVMANKQSLESGDKIILPPSALDHLARLRVQYPMVFSITARSSQRKTHCGVMEFSSEEGVAYLPYWMMQNLLIETGSIVDIYNVSLPKGTLVQFQPHSMEFTLLNNPRVVLERALRNFTCLTTGDTIAIQHGEATYFLDVKEVKPGNAISVIETDVNVDFLPPKDMPADELMKPSTLERAHSLGGSVHGAVEAHHGDVKAEDYKSDAIIKTPTNAGSQKIETSKPSYFDKLGSGHSLKNKKSSPTSASSSSSSSAGAAASSTSSAHTPMNGTTSQTHSSLPTKPKTIQKVQGRFTYIYEVDAKGNERLIRRIPTPANASSSSSTSTSASVPLSQRSGGHTLK